MDSKQVYEIGFHVLPTVTEENLGDEVATIRNAIEQKGGVIITEDFPKMRDLEYVMKKYIDTKKTSYDKAYFGWIKFETDSGSVQDLKVVADEHPNILRYLIMKTVRENALLTTPKERDEESSSPEEKKKGISKEKEEMSEKEVDKSIDELVIE